MNVKITIDPEFQSLCPRQTEEELKLLRESLIKEGCREPIICWKSDENKHLILDGMTRFAICTKEKINFKVQYILFPGGRREVIRWILANQLGRRNLTDTQRAILRGQLYNEMKRDPKKNLRKGGASRMANNCHSGDTAAKIAAKERDVSARTIRNDGKLAEAVEKLTDVTKTQITGTKVENSRAELKRLADLPPKQQEKVARVIGNGKAKTVAEAKKIARVKDISKIKQQSSADKQPILHKGTPVLLPECPAGVGYALIDKFGFDFVIKIFESLTREVDINPESIRKNRTLELVRFNLSFDPVEGVEGLFVGLDTGKEGNFEWACKYAIKLVELIPKYIKARKEGIKWPTADVLAN